VTFWCGSGKDPDLTPFFRDFKKAKKLLFFSMFFSYTLPPDYLRYSNLNFLLKFCVKILFCKHYFSPPHTNMRKGNDPEQDPYL
jgi:hypothetical protein